MNASQEERMFNRFVRRRLPLSIFAVLGLQLFLPGCASRKQVVPTPPAEYYALISEGDAYFAKSHLWGWRKALAAYKAARALFVGEELNSKLVLTAALVATREHDEGIRNERIESEVEAWVRPDDRGDQFLGRLTDWAMSTSSTCRTMQRPWSFTRRRTASTGRM